MQCGIQLFYPVGSGVGGVQQAYDPLTLQSGFGEVTGQPEAFAPQSRIWGIDANGGIDWRQIAGEADALRGGAVAVGVLATA